MAHDCQISRINPAYLALKKVGATCANLLNMCLMPMRVSYPLPGQDDGSGGHRRRA